MKAANTMATQDHDRSDEIVGLLNIIGKRLIDSEQERSDLKELVETQQNALTDLKEKTEASEKIYLDLKGRLSKREEAEEKLLKKQISIEDSFDEWQSEYSEKIEKALTVTEHMEEVMAQQNRLFRRIEQMTQDRARVTRKLERIEETVIETKDALEARAMVLLTDQQATEEADKPHTDTVQNKKSLRPVSEQDNHDAQDGLLWQYPRRAQIAIMTALLATAFAGGFAVTKVSYFHLPEMTVASSQSTKPAATEIAEAPLAAEQKKQTEKEKEREVEKLTSIQKDETVTSDNLVIEAAKQANTEEQLFSYKDEDALRTAMAENPDKLAKDLNTIEPVASGTVVPDKPEDIAPEEVTQKAKEQVQNVALTPAPRNTKAEAEDIEAFVKAGHDGRPLAKRIKPDPDLPEIVREIEKRAFEGVPEAQHDLAAIYTAGHGGVTVDYKKASFWFEEAAYNKIGNARYNLGVLYHQGLGVKQSTEKAILWYKAAANVGHPEAQYNLGIAYIEGIGVPYDPQKAASYFELSANEGITEAAYNLGIVHENGLVDAAKPEEALYWYKKAADQGSSEAKTALVQLSKKLGINPQKVEEILSDLETLNAPVKNDEAALRGEQSGSLQPAQDKSTSLKVTGSLAHDDLLGPDGKPMKKALALHESESGTPVEETAAAIKIATAEETERNNINDMQGITAQIQEQLVYLGLYPGPADGILTPLTTDAIRTYQSLYGLEVNGQVSEKLLAHVLMGAEEGYEDTEVAEGERHNSKHTDVGSRAE